MRALSLPCALLLASAAWLSPQPAQADEAMWKLLQRGGQVVLMRHPVTDPGVGDPEGMQLGDCSTQRNLNDEGRAHASRIGEALRARKVEIGRVLASPWCRCVETARLAVDDVPQPSPALGNVFGQQDIAPSQLAQLRQLAGDRPPRGNALLVSHGSTIFALTGVSPATGEMVVLTPFGRGQFRVAGRITVD